MVGRGENLRDIAKKYGVSATDVKRWNNLRRGKVKEGDELVIEVIERNETMAAASTRNNVRSRSQSGSDRYESSYSSKRADRTSASKKSAKAKKAEPKPTTHVVKSGDNLDRLARKYGTTVQAIQQANGMSKGTTRISIGQKLKIPAKGSSVKSSSKKSKAAASKSRKSSSKKKSSAKRRTSKKRR